MEKDEELDIKAGAAADSDLEDDELIQDWSEAARLTVRASTLPKSGEKDYEPDGTNTQELLLYRARKAMFETLSHSVRGTVVKNQVKAYYDPDVHMAVIFQPKGNFLQTMGKMHKDGTVWLEFQEFLYLAERGTVTPFYKMQGIDWRYHELPLSIEEIYRLFQSQQEMDNFFVFAHLKRLGFVVMSSRSQTDSFFRADCRPRKLSFFENHCPFPHWRRSLHNMFFYNPWSFWIIRYTSTPQIYRSLNQLIPFYKAPKTVKDIENERMVSKEKPSYCVNLNVWKPKGDFKKKNPGLPDYQIVIYNKNDPQKHFPTYADLKTVFKSLDYKFDFLSNSDNWKWDEHTYHDGKLRCETLAKSKQKGPSIDNTKEKQRKMMPKKQHKFRSPRALQKSRLKNGYRSFLLAVVDDGLISFVKISEADFGSEDVWYTPYSSNYAHRNQ